MITNDNGRPAGGNIRLRGVVWHVGITQAPQPASSSVGPEQTLGRSKLDESSGPDELDAPVEPDDPVLPLLLPPPSPPLPEEPEPFASAMLRVVRAGTV